MKVDRGKNVRLVVSLWRLVVSALRYFWSSRCFPSSTRRFRGRLIASWVCLVVLSVRFIGWPLRLVVLRVRLITDHIGSSSFVVFSFRRFVMAFHRLVMSFRRFDSSTQRGYNSTWITWRYLINNTLTWFNNMVAIHSKSGRCNLWGLLHYNDRRSPWWASRDGPLHDRSHSDTVIFFIAYASLVIYFIILVVVVFFNTKLQIQ